MGGTGGRDMSKYGLEAGRLITVDGEPHMVLARPAGGSGEARRPSAVDADAFAREVVDALNERAGRLAEEEGRRLAAAGEAGLDAARRAAAEREFEAYDFGGADAADASGWEDDGAPRLERTVYLERPGGRGGPGGAARFAVAFREGGAEVEDVGATLDGAAVGQRGTTSGG